MSVDLNSGPVDGFFNVNFRSRPVLDVAIFAKGYHKAANRLASEFSRNPDYDAYPIFFLYRHSLELYLKAVVHRGLELIELKAGSVQAVNIFKDHRLLRLLPSFRSILSAQGWKWDFSEGSFRTFAQFEELVKEIERVDPDSFTMRYPIKKDQTPTLPNSTQLNILTIAESMDEVLEKLEVANLALSVEFNLSAEATAELKAIQGGT